jgi:threonine dehydratase
MISLEQIETALRRISPWLVKTPIITSAYLNNCLGHNIFFKAESLQLTGSFKIRGVLNAIIESKSKNIKNFSCYSTGNHGLALAWAAREFGADAQIFMPSYTSTLKQNIVKSYGANLHLTRTRQLAETKAKEMGKQKGVMFLPPSDNDSVISGAATLLYESLLQEQLIPDAVFTSIGGGGLISGTYATAFHKLKKCIIIGAEPELAQDAYLSKKNEKIYRFKESPQTIADGLRTLGISERTFEYIKKIDDIILSSEDEIIYWTAWLEHLLKISCEPSSAVAMSAAFKWLTTQKTKRDILVMISGGNLDQEMFKKVWKQDHLSIIPKL